jgi:hypothetical protein
MCFNLENEFLKIKYLKYIRQMFSIHIKHFSYCGLLGFSTIEINLTSACHKRPIKPWCKSIYCNVVSQLCSDALRPAMRRATRVTLKSSIAVVCQLAALKGSAGAQCYLFGLTAVFIPSISCALQFQVCHSWILDVFHILTHFIQNRPHEIPKVAHLMKHEFGYPSF